MKMTNNYPATPLPWEYVDNGMVIVARDAPAQLRPVQIAQAVRGLVHDHGPEHATNDINYIAHACNAYPKLVEALRQCSKNDGNRAVYVAETMLRELGE
jgi:hypothetical protein